MDAEEDLYKILGVKRTATTKEIKTAYRRKALDTHPDKNKDVPPEKAAEEFHKVVHAFEILSDEESRKRYDRTGSTKPADSGGFGGGSGGGWSNFGGFHFQWSGGNFYHGGGNQRPRPRLKDRFDVQEAQSRVMHIVSFEQLQTVICDDNDLLERNLLICFVNPEQEKIANDEMVFPWPFAAMSTQGIWWEDLLQTVMIRYHNQNKITKFFGVPNGKTLTEPFFVFGKRGQKMENGESWARIQTKNMKEFHNWVWAQMEVRIKFVNRHAHPVEIYWIHDTRAKMTLTLEPGAESFHTTMLSHEWWVRDARTDTRKDSPGRYKLTKESMLAMWKIVDDEPNREFIIEAKTCFDLSGHCPFWSSQGECNKNPNFMAEQCRKTCALCSDQDDSKNSSGDEL